MSHLEAGLFHALLDGEVASDQLGPIQAHLAACTECRERLEQERQLLAEAAGLVEVLEVPAEARAHPPSVRGTGGAPWGPRLAWAASIVAAVGLGFVARGPRAPSSAREAEVAPAERVADSGHLAAAAQRADTPAPTAPVPLASGAPTTAEPATTAPATVSPRRAANAAARKAPLPKPAQKAVAARLEEMTTSAGPPDSAAAKRAVESAPPTASAQSGGAILGRLQNEPRRLTDLSETRFSRALLVAPEPIGLSDAVRRLGGSLRLIDGMIPLRLEAQGQTIRVVYPLAQGELVLSQQLIDGRVTFRLIAPPGFSADSLEKLRDRVRE
jgi:hypothetical protein